MRTVIDNDDLLISHRVGAGGGSPRRAIVAFAGINARFGGVPREEFSRTLARQDRDCFFVVDKRQSWYNFTAEQIISQLRLELASFDECMTVGNSMGGFGAIYFASRLPRCRAALAFGPQFSVNPDIAPQERRWSDYREAIGQWNVLHALIEADQSIQLYAFFGSGRDLYQASLFGTHGFKGLTMIGIPACRHDTAAYLRDRGSLPSVIETIWTLPEAAEVRMLLESGGIACHVLAPSVQ